MKIIYVISLLVVSTILLAQEKTTLNQINWELTGNAQKENYKGNDCLKTDKGSALAEDIVFHNGIIEFDMCIQEGRGFAGISFRGDGNGNSEEFYIRKHQSGNPDAMQYTPVYNGNAGWQLYYGDGFGAVKTHVFDEWFHIKLVVSGNRGEVFIDDMEKAILPIHVLKMGDCQGQVEFYGPARFANISIKEIAAPELKSEFKEEEQASEGSILEYSISEPFNDQAVLKANEINDLIANSTFKKATSEKGGLLNISKYTKFSRENNTVLLQIKIDSEKDTLKEMKIAFSDIAKVYLNGKAVWMGSDVYRSRDYRFLGTIGYFDSVFLNLKKGKNTVTIAVTENFGGWGVKTLFPDLDGITVL